MSLVPDLRLIVDWLGPEGAKAGLRESHMALETLVSLARQRGLPLSPKPTREEVTNELAFEGRKKIDRDPDTLMRMNKEELIAYFRKVLPTNRELEDLLDSLGVRYGSEERKHLARFAADELSDIGLFQRVAKGPTKAGTTR